MGEKFGGLFHFERGVERDGEAAVYPIGDIVDRPIYIPVDRLLETTEICLKVSMRYEKVWVLISHLCSQAAGVVIRLCPRAPHTSR